MPLARHVRGNSWHLSEISVDYSFSPCVDGKFVFSRTKVFKGHYTKVCIMVFYTMKKIYVFRVTMLITLLEKNLYLDIGQSSSKTLIDIIISVARQGGH